MNEFKKLRKSMNGMFGLFTIIKLFIICVSLFFVYPLAILAEKWAPGYVQQTLNDLNSYDTIPGMIFNISVFILAVFVPIAFYIFLSGKKADEIVMTRKPTFWQCACTLGSTALFTYIISYIANIIIQLIMSMFGLNLEAIDVGAPNNIWLIPFFIISLCVLPGFAEELLMRGIAIENTRKYGTGFAIVFSSICFSMLHNTIMQLPFAFAAGLSLAYFAIKFKSIWVAVITHFFLNLNSVILQILSTLFSTKEEIFFLGVYMLFMFFIILSFAIAGLILYGFKLPKQEEKIELPLRQKIGAVLLSPYFYTFLILFITVVTLNIIQMI
ncbi:MAG: Abortive infection protein [Clostridia bacterium]|nr:Abortive infection protein [Clostridia bacterium]